MHRQNLAKRCSAPPAPGQYSFHQPYQLEQQGQGLQAQTAQTQTQGRLHALLRQPTGYNHPPSTHTPAPLALARTRTSSPPPARARMSSPSRSPRAPHPLAHATPPLHQHQHQLGMLPPPHAPPDIVDLSSQPPPVDPSSVPDADTDAAGERALAPRPIYDFPSAVVMTEQIRTTRDTSSNRVLNQYLLGHRLGRGQHGDVYKGFDINRGYMVVAIKACRRKSKDRMEELRAKNAMERAAAAASGTSAEGRGLQRMGGGGGHLVDRLQSAERKVLREIAIMKKCKHGQIVQLLEVIDDRLTSKIFMVMEYMGGGEVKWRDSASPNALPVLRVDQARRICRDVILGLEYLHHQGIIHRDIKPANLLWTADRRGVKITDFGVSHFSYAQRLKAVRASEAYRRAVTKKRERLEREKEERERAERMEREKHWRFQGKGKARGAGGSGSGSSSGRVTPKPNANAVKEKEKEKAAGDEADDEDDADILEALEGTPDPLLLDDGGLSRQAGTPSFLAPEIIWEFRKERQDELVRRVGGLAGASTSATAGTSVGALGLGMGAGWFGGTRSRSGSDAFGAEGEGGGRDGEAGEESVSASASASASLLATHPAHSHSHSHSPVRPGEARSRSASNPNPVPQEKALPALPDVQDDVEHVPVGVNVIPPSESSRHGDEPTPPPRSRSPSPSPNSSTHGSPTLPSATANTNGRSPATATANGEPQPQPQPEPNPELAPSATTTTLGTNPSARPPITKAIDVWALGVTLYCLLCASCPWSGANEFVLYQAVHAQDFRVPPTLGYDAVPAGPRGLTRAQAEGDGEGAFVVWLLERLLEKDVEKRITLDEVKRLPWITRDIPDPEAWLRETSPQRHDPINVTAADESDAMSVLKFTWKRREAPASAVPGASSSPRAAGASGLNRIARAGGRMIKNLLPGRQRLATPGRSLGTLEDAEESDLAVHTDAGAGGGWLRSKSRVDLLSGNRNKGKGRERERERDDGEVAASSLRRTPSRKRRLAQATVEAVERVTRSGSTRSARSTRRRGKLPELKLSVKSEHTSHSRDSSLSRPGSRAQTPDPRVPTPLQMYAIPPYAVYPSIDEPVGGGPATPRARAGSTSALTSPSTADLSSDDILDEDDERVLEERERERERARVAREAARAEEDERVSRRSSIQKLWMFGRQRSSRSSLAEQNKKGKQRARAGTMGAASSSSAGSGLGFGMGSGAEGEAGSRTFLTRGLARRSEDNMRMGRGPGQEVGATSYAAATSSMGPRTGSGPAFAGGMGMGMMGMGLTAGTGFDGDGGPLTTGELTNAMRAQSWEGSGAAYAARPEDYDVMSDLDGQSVVYEDEDVRMVGAGGVLSNPGTVPGSPASHSHSHSHSRSGGSLSAQVQSHVDSLWLSDAVASAYGHGHGHAHGPPIPLIHPQGDHLLHPLNVPAIADPALQDPARAGGGGGAYQISSPLAQTPLNSFDESPFDEHYARARRVEQILQGETRSPSRSPSRSSRTGTRSLSRDVRRRQRHADPGYVRYGDEDENSSFESGERVYGQGQTTLQDDIEDSGSDEEEEAEEAIVVRRRRPSESLARSRSQIRRDDD